MHGKLSVASFVDEGGLRSKKFTTLWKRRTRRACARSARSQRLLLQQVGDPAHVALERFGLLAVVGVVPGPTFELIQDQLFSARSLRVAHADLPQRAPNLAAPHRVQR